MNGLLSKQLASKLPKLYDTEHEPLEDKTALAKFFHPTSNWTWYVIEFDGEDLCWGLVVGHEVEFGYFSLAELSQVIGPFGLRIERDIFFRPTTIKDLAAFGQGGLVY
jgi:hypothetical protein